LAQAWPVPQGSSDCETPTPMSKKVLDYQMSSSESETSESDKEVPEATIPEFTGRAPNETWPENPDVPWSAQGLVALGIANCTLPFVPALLHPTSRDFLLTKVPEYAMKNRSTLEVIAKWSLGATTLFHAGYGIMLYSWWCQEFRDADDKLCRTDPHSPSNRQRPKVKPRIEYQKAKCPVGFGSKEAKDAELPNLLEHGRGSVGSNAGQTPANKRSSASSLVEVVEEETRENDHLAKRSLPRMSIAPAGLGRSKKRLSDGSANNLDMNHIFISFSDYYWGYYAIGPNAVHLWVTGINKLMLRQSLHWMGLIKPKVDYERLAGNLIMESAECVNYSGMYTRQGRRVATFTWTMLPLHKGTESEENPLELAGMLQVWIDAATKKMVKAKMDGRKLTASEVVILVWMDTIFANHVKMHSYANWGLNVLIKDPFVRQNSITTVLYNHFGKSAFPKLCALWKFFGLTRVNHQVVHFTIDHGIEAGVRDHRPIHELAPYSELVGFLTPVRNFFMNTFDAHRAEFPGIDGEALFIGTILHSLDHTLMEWNLTDPLHLDTTHPEFGAMAEIGRFVRVGFVPNLQGLSFTKRFRDATHPFYAKIYEHAARVNKRLADQMDTCIIK